LYSGVKSRVGGNIKTQKKVAKGQVLSAQKRMSEAFGLEQPENGPALTMQSSSKKTAASSNYRTSTFSSNKKTTGPTYKSKLASNQMEAIIANIKGRFSQDVITGMS
jgi:hypothetical protein